MPALPLLIILFIRCLPSPLFDKPLSTVAYAAEGELLGAKVAADEQWRFPEVDSVPAKYAAAVVAYEDRRFRRHCGVDILAIARAMVQNVRAGAVVSGGSTLTMQLMRMATGAERTLGNKLLEAVRALRLECSLSKEEILRLYASHAPYGGNVVGLEAAAWRYFGRAAAELSWAEAAMLAVLPNAPGLIHTARNRNLLRRKRNSLLRTLATQGHIDSLNLSLALDEAIPAHPHAIPQLAPHLLVQLVKQGEGQRHHTAIDRTMQESVADIVARHHRQLARSDIHNAAALVIDVPTGDIKAYIGNTAPLDGASHHNHVDIVRSRRSTGSLLKPLLYAAAIDEGIILPQQLVADIPTFYTNFAPKNFTRTFDGAVPADKALSRSLNVPAVRLLMSYNVAKFHSLLRKLGFYSIDRPASHYGLSLILGGAEASLLEFGLCYANLMRNSECGMRNYGGGDVKGLSEGALFATFEAMKQLARPEEEQGWAQFASQEEIAWKTGTSFGYRDAWSVGVTPQHVVAVWVGNADGEGKPGIVGGRAAAPIMFDIFRTLPVAAWGEAPLHDMEYLAVCRTSGFKASPLCPTDTVIAPLASVKGKVCPYHHLVHLNREQTMRVDAQCCPPSEMVHKAWFTLPPAMEHYYCRVNPLYQKLPPLHPLAAADGTAVMELLYPQASAKVLLPIGLDGKRQSLVVRLAHREPAATVYWHLDNDYLGETTSVHEMEIQPNSGRHLLSFTDTQGNSLRRHIEIVSTQ